MNATFDASARKSAIPIVLHGDEGHGKKDRSVLILNWHVLTVQTTSVLLRKFPIAAPELYVVHARFKVHIQT